MKVIDRLTWWLEAPSKKQPLEELYGLNAHLQQLRKRHSRLSKLIRKSMPYDYRYAEFVLKLKEIEEDGIALCDKRERLTARIYGIEGAKVLVAPKVGERLLLLILTKEERVNIPGDLEEEFAEIAAKHGERFAKVWYYKQVAASAWPLVRKALRWGIIIWGQDWIRQNARF